MTHRIAAVAGVVLLTMVSCARTERVVTLSVPSRSNANATIASDGSRVIVAWGATGQQGTDIYAAVSKDGGRRFGAPIRVNDAAGEASVSGEQPPRVDLRGEAIEVVWVAKRGGLPSIRAASSRGGASFAASRAVSPPSLMGARGWQSAAIADDGSVHAVWLDGRFAASGSNVGHTHGAGHGHGAADPRQDVYHAVWRDGAALQEVRVDTDVCFCCKTAIVTRGQDVYTAWRDLFPGGVRDISVAHSTDGGRTFGTPARVSADNWKINACPDDGPALALDGAGALHVVWPTMVDDNGTPRIAIFHAVTRDGRTFSARERVDGARGTDPAHPRIAARADGRLAVVWDELSNGARRIALRTFEPDADGGGAWTDVRVVSDDRGANYPAVTLTPDAVVVAWTARQGERPRIRVARVVE